MCIRDRAEEVGLHERGQHIAELEGIEDLAMEKIPAHDPLAVSYTHLRAHETVLDLVCRLLLEKKKTIQEYMSSDSISSHDNIYSDRYSSASVTR